MATTIFPCVAFSVRAEIEDLEMSVTKTALKPSIDGKNREKGPFPPFVKSD